MPELLTEKQKAVLTFIRQHIEKEHVSPTVREVAAYFGFRSPLSAQLHLRALMRKGYITKAPQKNRNIRIIGLNTHAGKLVPLLGRVRPGKPTIAIEDIETHIAIDKTIFRGKDTFALRAIGDSMIEAGILGGDIVIVKPEKEPANGSIAVVLVHGEVTIKRFFRNNGTVRLVPENTSLKPATVSVCDIQIVARVIGVMRRL